MKIEINKIKIPEYYTPPNDEKYRKKEHSYKQGGYLSPIILDDNNMLVDGYISYLILKRNNVEEVEYVPSSYNDNMVMYISGVHPNCKKEYVWMVPRRMIKAFTDYIKPGDRVFCYSNNKVAPVIVKSIFKAPRRDRVGQVAGC